MSVVCCKVSKIRPRYQNLKEWMEDDSNVYIGRGGVVFIENPDTGIKERFPKNSSPFHNPFKIGNNGTRAEVIQMYREYIVDKLNNDKNLKKMLLNLKGKNLGCWCHPEPCHGDVLLELIDKLS